MARELLPRADIPWWLCHNRISPLLGAIKSYFKGQSLNFMQTKCVGGY
jgi:hypothetical protein